MRSYAAVLGKPVEHFLLLMGDSASAALLTLWSAA